MARADVAAAGGEVDDLPLMDAEHGMDPSPQDQGQMDERAEAAIAD